MLKLFNLSILIASLVIVGGCKKSDNPANKSGSDSSVITTDGQIEAGETYTNDAAKVDFQLPQGWILETDEESITAFPKEGGFLVQFYLLESDDLDKTTAEALKILNLEIINLKTDQMQEENINDLKSKLFTGNSAGVHLIAGVIDVPADNLSMLIAAWGVNETVQKYEREVNSIIKSVKRAN